MILIGVLIVRRLAAGSISEYGSDLCHAVDFCTQHLLIKGS